MSASRAVRSATSLAGVGGEGRPPASGRASVRASRTCSAIVTMLVGSSQVCGSVLLGAASRRAPRPSAAADEHGEEGRGVDDARRLCLLDGGVDGRLEARTGRSRRSAVASAATWRGVSSRSCGSVPGAVRLVTLTASPADPLGDELERVERHLDARAARRRAEGRLDAQPVSASARADGDGERLPDLHENHSHLGGRAVKPTAPRATASTPALTLAPETRPCSRISGASALSGAGRAGSGAGGRGPVRRG